MVKECEARFRRIDVLVNNVGTYSVKPFNELTDADWQSIIETNFYSGLRLSRLYLPGMLNRNWGRIIFISSESGVQIPVEMIHYGVTKTMQLALSRGLAETTVGTGVTVNSVLPGPTRSRRRRALHQGHGEAKQGKSEADLEKDFFKDARPSSLIQRFATNEEVANLVAYVASPLSSPPTAPPCASTAAWSGRSCRFDLSSYGQHPVHMTALTYTAARENLATTMNKVCENHEPVIITRNRDQAVVMMSLEDYTALEETAYLTRSPANAQRLLRINCRNSRREKASGKS